jgi:hypothetical protein
MKVLVKPIREEEYSLVEGYCEKDGNYEQTSCWIKGDCLGYAYMDDVANADDEILF